MAELPQETINNFIKAGYQQGRADGYFKGVSDFALAIERAYLDDNIDECEINRRKDGYCSDAERKGL